jgi:hypothetical protein
MIFLKEEAPAQKEINDAPHPLLPMRRVVRLGCGMRKISISIIFPQPY